MKPTYDNDNDIDEEDAPDHQKFLRLVKLTAISSLMPDAQTCLEDRTGEG